MNTSSGLITAIVVIVIVVVVILLILGLFAKNYKKVPPNTVGVFTGRGRTKTVRGGARLKMPFIERYDEMSLEPFNIESPVSNVYSRDGVPVNVVASALVRFGSTEDALATAVERFLTTNRETLLRQVTEIVAGCMRNIVSQLTVEELNSNRDEFIRRVKEEAERSFQPIGMQLDVFNIQSISDNNGYLDALGQKRIAEVKRDASMGRADAERESAIRTAEADQASQVARALAETQIAEANMSRDLRKASIDSDVAAARAKSAQAGPLAQAEAERAVVLAGVLTERERTEAQIAVEQQRTLQTQQSVQSDIIIPAEAQKTASIARAQGEREARIAAAEANAREKELSGKADSDARVLLASARQAEMVAEAEGNKAQSLAEAEGIRALKAAEAEGQEKMAEALNKLSDRAARLNILPQVVAVLPQMARAIADGVKIDKMVVLDGGGTDADQGALARALGITPSALGKMNEVMGAMGLDINGLLGGLLYKDPTAETEPKAPAPAAVAPRRAAAKDGKAPAPDLS
jgi:flotillin